MNTKQTLLDFSAVFGVAGREDEAADFGAALLEPYGKVCRNPLGAVICQVWEAGPDAPRLLLDAHLDEIGLIVTHIEEKGFLRVAPCGGVDRRIVLAAPVVIQGARGKVHGVICSTPPHLAGKKDNKNPRVEDIYIDIGCTKKQAEKLVSPGDRLTIHAPSRSLLGDLCSGKAIDDRAGCVAILHALELLRGQPPTCNLAVTFSTMEEVGGQGAKTAANALSPTHAIAVDMSFAHTPDAPRQKCGLMGKGPMVGFSPILSAALSRELCQVAREEDIPFQTEVMGGKTGTNADYIVTARTGVVTGLLSVPQKYMHTPIETVSIADVENTGRLLAAYIRRMSQKGGR